MRFTLFKKMLISLLFISFLMILGMAWLINSSFQRGLQDYLNQSEEEKLKLIAEQIAPYYSERSEWQSLDIEQWKFVLAQVFIQSIKNKKEMKQAALKHAKRGIKHNIKRVDLLDRNFNPIFQSGKPHPINQQIRIPVKYQGETIAWVSTKKRSAISGGLEKNFYHQQQRNFMWIVLWVTLLSFVLAWFLVRHLLTPLKRLENAANSLQQGDYTTQIEVEGEDELANLSERFNELSLSLQRQKENREQWLSDISHELRTPISVLRSEIEALQDGIRQPEPRYIDSLHSQVQNLSQLVNDLYQLSLSDAGLQFDLSERIDVQKILAMSCSQYLIRCQEREIQLDTFIDLKEATHIMGDQQSLIQLFSNLLENSLRYTDAAGKLRVELKVKNDQLKICIEDSMPGVPDNALPKLFERLYRVDESRSRLSGGSGLGLTICETIVHAHQGKISASHSPLGGLAITINLPLPSVSK